jgi:hypothetical protein
VVACPVLEMSTCVFVKDCVLDLMMIHFHKAVKQPSHKSSRWLISGVFLPSSDKKPAGRLERAGATNKRQ